MHTAFDAETPLDTDLTIVAQEGQVSSTIGEERIILSLEEGVYYGLNAVGARVWSLIQQPTTIGAVRDRLLEEYDVEPAPCEHDLQTLLRDLDEQRLIEVLEDETVPDAAVPDAAVPDAAVPDAGS